MSEPLPPKIAKQRALILADYPHLAPTIDALIQTGIILNEKYPWYLDDVDIRDTAERYLLKKSKEELQAENPPTKKKRFFRPGFASDNVMVLIMLTEPRIMAPPPHTEDTATRRTRSLFVSPLTTQTILVQMKKYDEVVSNYIVPYHNAAYAVPSQANLKAVQTITYQTQTIMAQRVQVMYNKLRGILETPPRLISIPYGAHDRAVWPPINTPFLLGDTDAPIQLIIIPVNYPNTHWWLLVYFYDRANKCYWRLRIDSLDWDDLPEFKEHVLAEINRHDAFLRLINVIAPADEIPLLSCRKDVISQDMGYGSCGMHCINRGFALERDFYTLVHPNGLTIDHVLSWPAFAERYRDKDVCTPLLLKATRLAQRLTRIVNWRVGLKKGDKPEAEEEEEEEEEVEIVQKTKKK